MNVYCVECGQPVCNFVQEKDWESHQLCVACFVAWIRLSNTTVTKTDLDNPIFDPPIDDLPLEIQERIRTRIVDRAVS